jgi:predicted amidohydrolase YtcJ
VVLDRNLYELDPARLHTARVLLTLLDGDPVFRDAAIAWPGAETP